MTTMYKRERYVIKCRGPMLFSTRGWLYVGYGLFILACLLAPWWLL